MHRTLSRPMYDVIFIRLPLRPRTFKSLVQATYLFLRGKIPYSNGHTNKKGLHCLRLFLDRVS